MSTDLKRLQRTLHLICNCNGAFLYALVGGEALWTVAPLVAVDSGMAWLSSTEAAERLRMFRQLHPQTTASLATLHMEADPATPQAWTAASVRTWSTPVLQEPAA